MIYNAALLLALPLFIARIFVRGLRAPAYSEQWQDRLGFPAPLPPGTLWLHAVSVGEVNAAVPLIKAIKESHPHLPVLVTTSTATGRQILQQRLGALVEHRYYPYDFWPCARWFIGRVQPRALIILETELWPNMIGHCHALGVPVLLINARMSERSSRRYRLAAALTAEMLGRLNSIAAQTGEDAARLVALGAPRERVSVTGSLKFDIVIQQSLLEQAQSLRREIGVSRPILMAGSTRDGEEPLVLEAFRILLEQYPNLLLILAPRHPERNDGVHEQCRRQDLLTVRRSAGQPVTDKSQVLLLDTMGELLPFYGAVDVAFVGGSLVKLGGQNLLEPAGMGVPVVTGPHTFNFTRIAQLLADAGGLFVVADAAALAAQVGVLLGDSNLRDAAGNAARDVYRQNQGAANRVLELVSAYLSADPPGERQAS
ncbi:MAG: 3-deoxy-D-manno-octulosonic acid transferase [Gammaproteobacteria bacterium]|nr:3-deoxy-D-manno-octulosonic acid transferase [Gammaproteobacteria bacterium]